MLDGYFTLSMSCYWARKWAASLRGPVCVRDGALPLPEHLTCPSCGGGPDGLWVEPPSKQVEIGGTKTFYFNALVWSASGWAYREHVVSASSDQADAMRASLNNWPLSKITRERSF